MNEEEKGKEKAGVERGLYMEEECTILAVCRSIKSSNNSEHFERDY